jgi:hypothetical protein
MSSALYGIIFSRHPQNDADRIAEQLVNDDGSTREWLDLIVADIREELARPKQRVREVLPLAHDESVVSEADVREFLARVADRITEALQTR